MSDSSDESEYKVGYKRPPLETRWKPGQCGNPRNKRDRRLKPIVPIIDRALSETVDIVMNGESRRVTTSEAIVLQLSRRALSGDIRAFRVLMRYRKLGVDPERRPEIVVRGGLPRQIWTEKRGREMSDYEVGYGKPPRQSQFKKGASGNPSGRRKRNATDIDIEEVITRVLTEPVKFRVRGKPRKAPRIELLIKTLAAAAASGDVRSAAQLLDLRAKGIDDGEVDRLIIEVEGGLPVGLAPEVPLPANASNSPAIGSASA